MELRISSEAFSSSASPEIPYILRKPKGHYLVDKNLPLVPVLSQINTIHALPPASIMFPGYVFALSSLLHGGFPSDLFPSSYPKALCASLPHMCHMLCTSQSCFDNPNIILGRVQIVQLVNVQFPRVLFYLVPRRPKYFLSTLFSIPHNPCSSVDVR
jgi:hypothetical protein